MSGGERRRIVQPVADHQHLAALRCRASRAAILSAGFRFRLPACDAKGGGHAGRRPPVLSPDKIAHIETALRKAGDRRRRVWPQASGGRETPPRRRNATNAIADTGGTSRRDARATKRKAAEPRFEAIDRARARPDPDSSTRRSNGAAHASRLRATAPGQRMTARQRPAARLSPAASASTALGIGDLRIRQGQRAGLVEHDRVDLGQTLDSRAALIMMPARNSAPRATTCTAGTASASAQGQVMISTAIAMIIAWCSRRRRAASRERQRGGGMDDGRIERARPGRRGARSGLARSAFSIRRAMSSSNVSVAGGGDARSSARRVRLTLPA